jgi:hypothetical protein
MNKILLYVFFSFILISGFDLFSQETESESKTKIKENEYQIKSNNSFYIHPLLLLNTPNLCFTYERKISSKLWIEGEWNWTGQTFLNDTDNDSSIRGDINIYFLGAKYYYHIKDDGFSYYWELGTFYTDIDIKDLASKEYKDDTGYHLGIGWGIGGLNTSNSRFDFTPGFGFIILIGNKNIIFQTEENHDIGLKKVELRPNIRIGFAF